MNPAYRKGVVLTMGTFDGVHQGHRSILRRTVELARKHSLPSLAVTFSKPPRLFFFPPDGPSLLTLLDEKIGLLKSQGIGHVEVLPFGAPMARLSAESFFDRYFRRRFNAREIVVGYNFGFGAGRRGDTRFLEAHGARAGIPVHVVPPVCLGRVPISSGQIRANLRMGDLAGANRKLGYPYFLSAKVEKGLALGRELGYPTANLKAPAEKLLPSGVFAVRVTLPGGLLRRGMCNVGSRPTLGQGADLSVEVHVLDFVGNLVGKTLRLDFIKKLREEKKFPSLRALALQLKRDERAARRALALS